MGQGENVVNRPKDTTLAAELIMSRIVLIVQLQEVLEFVTLPLVKGDGAWHLAAGKGHVRRVPGYIDRALDVTIIRQLANASVTDCVGRFLCHVEM
jgi:hypothetical protein